MNLFRGDGVTQTELADTLEIEKPTLGRLLDRLEAKGWVRREHDASDRRVWRVHLTAEVEPALRTMRKIAAELRRDALTGIVGQGDADWREDERLAFQVALQVDVQAKYTGYIDRQHEEIERQRCHEETGLPAEIDYAAVRGLSNEVRQRLLEHRPATLGQAARIPGVTPAAVSLLLVLTAIVGYANVLKLKMPDSDLGIST